MRARTREELLELVRRARQMVDHIEQKGADNARARASLRALGDVRPLETLIVGDVAALGTLLELLERGISGLECP